MSYQQPNYGYQQGPQASYGSSQQTFAPASPVYSSQQQNFQAQPGYPQQQDYGGAGQQAFQTSYPAAPQAAQSYGGPPAPLQQQHSLQGYGGAGSQPTQQHKLGAPPPANGMTVAPPLNYPPAPFRKNRRSSSSGGPQTNLASSSSGGYDYTAAPMYNVPSGSGQWSGQQQNFGGSGTYAGSVQY